MSKPAIIAHRGASGYRPEHTLAAYELAIAQGAEAIELDIVPTKDGELVVRHDSELSQTTDIITHRELSHYRTTKTIYGQTLEGWFTEDLTRAEIKTLQAKEPFSFRSSDYDFQFPILTLSEVLDWHQVTQQKVQRPIDLYIEIKHSHYFRSLGLSIEEPLIELLQAQGYQFSTDPILILSFEIENLQYLRSLTNLRLIQLMAQAEDRPYDRMVQGDPVTYQDLLSLPQLTQITQYANGLGLQKQLLWSNGRQTLVDRCHNLNLTVNVWTFRQEPQFVLPDFSGDWQQELQAFINLGIDGLVTDFPDIDL
ncbi:MULTISPECIES: glycerophosphodiester phosphodiesterase family protein [unclassified Roseofilum]|uniref:glycerophosphodiester phosphodiesterase family protein n=1 Tax=unclassified Roseofilum TaxID=2620099 RepID=UPI000E8E01B4|nr:MULTISPECIES: glycerophosphodiester phosphodiesterase family protein [unclassified Roseofilum]HBQ98871.1 glycerophosphodiester phosphodiesterase [Cyanobacteria bacterium UBA11691]MBP0009541.1 glycerophosphodiester phosphodiesterase [Roseofilum sp. Belize Diploria]MBP0013709.1 glycerophosphodiester phosphodiesterase [Roseofilum sp. SID3]MBP0024922.1 glycerophosphodiester phosphodiesterase [Roseofilum sp. SID2]MBP0032728.1 glycerophosphodiester phosphodiesterase [Roseofilum sp. Belize BBD 4]